MILALIIPIEVALWLWTQDSEVGILLYCQCQPLPLQGTINTQSGALHSTKCFLLFEYFFSLSLLFKFIFSHQLLWMTYKAVTTGDIVKLITS